MKNKAPIFRILDLHDLVNMLENNELRLRQAIKMTDKNEAIGFYFGLLNSGFYLEGDELGMRASLKNIQSATYITSWAFIADDIALWSLYSPKYNGVQIEVDYNQLEEIFRQYFLDNIFAKAYSLEPHDPRLLIREQQFGNVEYLDLQKEYEKYSNLREKYSEFCAENYDRDDFLEVAVKWMSENSSSFDHSKRYLQKDNRYIHEKEVRGILQVCRRDGRTVEEYKSDPMAGLDDPAEIIPPDDCPENIFVPIPKGFVRSIKVDGRLPYWKLSAVKKVLEKYEIDIDISEAFSPQFDKGKWF